MAERRVCVVADQLCTAPAGYGVGGIGFTTGDGSARATCFHCNEPVCTSCSTRRMYHKRVKRFCHNCEIELYPNAEERIYNELVRKVNK